MIFSRILLSVAFIAGIYLPSFSQEPCMTEAFKGYKGDCNITKAISADGRYIFTSDRLTLKIWDIATNKVVDEINAFPFDIVDNSQNPDRIYVRQPNDPGAAAKAYDLKARSLVVPVKILTPEIAKLLASETTRYMELPEFEAVVYTKDSKLKKLNTRTKKTVSLGRSGSWLVYIPEAKVLICARSIQNIEYLHILNLETDTWIETKNPSVGTERGETIDNRYVPFFKTNSLMIVDTQTGNIVVNENAPFNRHVEPKFLFKPDRSGFYFFSSCESCGVRGEKAWTSDIFEFTYPGFKLVSQTPFNEKILPGSLFNPVTETFYSQPRFAPGVKKDMDIIDFRTGANKGQFVLEEKGNFVNAEKFATERDHRTRVGNQAIEALNHIKASVNPSHSPGGITNRLIIDDHAKDGKVIIREDQFRESICITWKFPEGTPEYFYESENSNRRTNAPGAIIVPTVIQNSMLSPSGNEAGFNTEGGAFIYQGNKLLYKGEKKILKALLDGKAVICTPEKYINPTNYQCSKLELVDLISGTVINSALTNSYEGESVDGTKLFLSFSAGPTPVLKMLDINNPNQIITATGGDIEKSGFPMYTVAWNSSFRKHKVTGNEEMISGYRIPNIGAFQEKYLKIKANYIMSFDPSYGFNVLDIAKGKSIAAVPLYAGWWEYDDMTYIESINKLLVVNRAPSYTWSNPDENDPGASAFTIDIETGTITPYLTTQNRLQYLAVKKASAAAMAYKYSPEGICKARNNQYSKGVSVFQNGVNFYGIVLGYDCEEEVYVVAYKELVDQKESLYQLRLKKSSFEELSALDNGGSLYRICPSCHGHPVDFKTSTVSGWSDWEQKSLNIYVYTKEWETKTVTKKVVCQVCKGAAFIR